MEEEIDEETQNSFRRAQMFFAARAVGTNIPKPDPITPSGRVPKSDKKQKH